LRVHLLTPLLFVLASGSAAGQDARQRVEIFAGAGAARVGGDEGSLGNGVYLVGGLGFRFAARASVEVDLMRAQHERNIAGGPLEGTASLRPQSRLVFREATGVMGLAAASVVMGYHW
jgi:hypothetical protein